MARIDSYLKAMLRHRADELHLATDAEPAFRVEGSLRRTGSQKLPQPLLMALLDEVLPPEAAKGLGATETLEFAYEPDGGPAVCCQVTQNGERVQAVFRLHHAAGGPSSAPPPLRPLASPPPGSPAPPDARSSPPPPPAGGEPEIHRFFHLLVERGGSDLHLSPGELPMLRLHGDMTRLEEFPVLAPGDTARILTQIMPQPNRAEFEERNDTDFGYQMAGLGRFRCNVFRDRKGIGGVVRVIPTKTPTVEDLGLSREIQALCQLHKGLVLVTGPTGSGKSTTLAALLDLINRTRMDHVITIEDPIEFVHDNKECLINQREVRTHTGSFKAALRAALREDPDIVLVGEMRDLETIAIALETAETGHLVFGTLHTSTAASTVDRIIDQFPADRQSQVRMMLAESLRAVISQTLCKRLGGGRVAALEVLLATPAVANLIREGKTFQIPSVIQTNKKLGMVLLNDALTQLVKEKKVEAKEAYRKAVDKPGLLGQLKREGIDTRELDPPDEAAGAGARAAVAGRPASRA